jgi:hypothetical protein
MFYKFVFATIGGFEPLLHAKDLSNVNILPKGRNLKLLKPIKFLTLTPHPSLKTENPSSEMSK